MSFLSRYACACVKRQKHIISPRLQMRARARLNVVIRTLRALWGVRSPRRQAELPQLFGGWVSLQRA